MVYAMLSIGLLGFIVWAHMGLHIRKNVVIKLRYMLETTSMINSNSLICKMLITIFFPIKVQSAGNNSVNYTPLSRGFKRIGGITLTLESFITPIQIIETVCFGIFRRQLGTFGKANYSAIGSSETTREVSASEYPYWFEDWFVGFVEGDGGFYVDINSKRFYLKIRQKNPQILYKIRDYFKFGSVRKDSDGYCTFSVQDRKSINRLLTVFNGKLLLNKTNKQFLNNWVLNYNCWFKDSPLIYEGKRVGTNILNSGWLCGFTDADGSLGFKLVSDSTRRNSYGKRLRVYWYIDQVDEIETLTLIKDILGFGRLEKKIPTPNQYPSSCIFLARRLITDSCKNCIILRDYFDKFNPQTNKLRIRWIRWKRILGYLETGDWKNRLDEISHLIKLNQDLN
jgi:hypothetical protein